MNAARGLPQSFSDAARFVQVEVRQEDQVKGAIDTATNEWGRLDCIFNNAGFGGVLGPIEDIPIEEFDMSFDVLVKGVFLGMKHAIPVMRKQGAGSIINTGSIAAITAGRGPMVYAACKAAVVHLSKVTAMSVADDSIRVNAICPGYIATPLSTNTVGRPDSLIEGRIEGMEHQQPIPRVGRPDDADGAHLCRAIGPSFITGQALGPRRRDHRRLLRVDQKEVYKTHYPIKVYNPTGDREKAYSAASPIFFDWWKVDLRLDRLCGLRLERVLVIAAVVVAVATVAVRLLEVHDVAGDQFVARFVASQLAFSGELHQAAEAAGALQQGLDIFDHVTGANHRNPVLHRKLVGWPDVVGDDWKG